MEKRNFALNSPSSGKDFRLDGKVAIVTGGGSGIGQAIALRFAANGATVRIADINLKQAEATAKQITDAGGQGTAHACDVTDQRQVRQIFKEFFAKERIEILVNNAGISHIGTVESTTEEDFDRLFRVNVKGIYNGIQACIGHMKASGGRVILNIASIAGSASLSEPVSVSLCICAAIASGD